jgi:hypothetical protein
MTITIPDPSAAETKGLQRATSDYNAQVAAQTPPNQTPVVLTPVQYLRQRVVDLVQSYAVQDLDAERTELAASYRNASDAQRQAARAALGLP